MQEQIIGIAPQYIMFGKTGLCRLSTYEAHVLPSNLTLYSEQTSLINHSTLPEARPVLESCSTRNPGSHYKLSRVR